MRIISGHFKGKKIFLPEDKITRPLRDIVKESIFNLLKHTNKFDFKIQNSQILDLFSGSGSFGLECISRGAKKVTFLENYNPVIKTLKTNILNLNLEKNSIIVEKDCFDYLDTIKDNTIKYDLIFIDPPFKENRISILINNIKNKKILKKNGIIVIHRHKKDNIEINKYLKILEIRDYGISKIVFGN